MNPEDKKYVWWGLLGIGVAALFYFLSANKSSNGGGGAVTVPYLVPQSTNGASPTADTSLSNQPNIVGSSPNSTIPNFSNPFGVSANANEAPGTWGFWPQLNVSSPTGPNNSFNRWGYPTWGGNPNSGGTWFPEQNPPWPVAAGTGGLTGTSSGPMQPGG